MIRAQDINLGVVLTGEEPEADYAVVRRTEEIMLQSGNRYNIKFELRGDFKKHFEVGWRPTYEFVRANTRREIIGTWMNRYPDGRPRGIPEEKIVAETIAGIEAGMDYATADSCDLSKESLRQIYEAAKSHGAKVIDAYHDFVSTPDLKDAVEIFETIRARGPHYVKMATMSTDFQKDSTIANALLDHARDTKTQSVITLMGPEAAIFRIYGPLKGSKLSYTVVPLPGTVRSAKGQMDLELMLVFFDALVPTEETPLPLARLQEMAQEILLAKTKI